MLSGCIVSLEHFVLGHFLNHPYRPSRIVKWSLSQISNPILILIYYLTYWRRGALMATRHCSPVSLEHFGPGQGGNGVVGSIMIFLDVFIVISWIANNWTSVFWTDLGFSCCTRNGRQSYIWGHWSWNIKNMGNYRYDFESLRPKLRVREGFALRPFKNKFIK